MSGHTRKDGGAPAVPMDIQRRTLKVSNLDDLVTRELLNELFIQVGPVRNIVHRNDFAFIEFEDEVSVAYGLALLDRIQLYGRELTLNAKISSNETYKYVDDLRTYEEHYAKNPTNWWAKFGNPKKPVPAHICLFNIPPQHRNGHNHFFDNQQPSSSSSSTSRLDSASYNLGSHFYPHPSHGTISNASTQVTYGHPPSTSLDYTYGHSQPPHHFTAGEYNYRRQPSESYHQSRRAGKSTYNRPRNHYEKPPYHHPHSRRPRYR